MTELVRIAVPVALDRDFTYRSGAPLEPGTRVLVPFGQRILVGLVRPGPATAPTEGKLRDVLERLDPPGAPALTPDLVSLCEWIADYYLAPAGEVVRLALPGLLTAIDARELELTEAGEARAALGDAPLLAGGAQVALTRDQLRLLSALAAAGGRATGRDLPRVAAKIAGPFARVAELEALGLVAQGWAGEAMERTPTEDCYRRTDYLRGGGEQEAQLQEILGRSKQRRALLDYLETQEQQGEVAAGRGEGPAPDAEDDQGAGWVPISELRGPFPRARTLLTPLLEAGLVAAGTRERRLDPFEGPPPEPSAPQAPTEDQARALERLRAALATGEFHSFLLHGITGSGKTEVYLQLISDALEAGGGAILLVPEIALTPQLSDRFRARFGDAVAVLHSGLSPRRRLDAWERIRRGSCRIAIGARSAIFAPVPDLRVIVVDEEHDASFKQEEGVRYNARDVALVRGKKLGAVVVLGSATPSLESFHLAAQGRHERLVLSSRPTPRPLPTVELLALKDHQANPDTMMSARLRDAVLETAEAGEQAIIFLNRRGYATTLVCGACGSLVQCPDCSAPSMTYHLGRNRLVCHLCGHMEAPPERCPKCGEAAMGHGSPGTERIEIAIERELPGLRVARLDRDTSRGKRLLAVLDRFRAREADVLVGTQMLAKGHDFPGVTLVGILQGDHGLGLPDLRAAERTFQLVSQVAGRAGRGERPGRVMVQAWAVAHPALQCAAAHDYAAFAALELDERREIGNPPFGHLALLRVVGADVGLVQARIEGLATQAARLIAAVGGAEGTRPVDLLGPVPSPIERVNRRTRWQILLRSRERGALRAILQRLRPMLGHEGRGPSLTVATADVDPQNLM